MSETRTREAHANAERLMTACAGVVARAAIALANDDVNTAYEAAHEAEELLKLAAANLAVVLTAYEETPNAE